MILDQECNFFKCNKTLKIEFWLVKLLDLNQIVALNKT